MGRTAWGDGRAGAIRGVTVGPIESALHADVGYGTVAGRAAMAEARAMGATWVAVTPFGRVWDLHGGGVDLTFEKPLAENTRAVATAIRDAHAEGLRVLVVPHLWVETGGWRALIDPKTSEGWADWTESYRRFVHHWAVVAEEQNAEMFSVGVELRSWVTTARAPSFVDVIRTVRERFRGLVTYSGNWDDVVNTVILGELDVIGVNAFFPLAEREGATLEQLLIGGERVARDLGELAAEWDKPVMLTEMGYTNRADPALRPWEWPDTMTNVRVDERAQALAYLALLAPLTDEPWCAGFFVWRTYADPDDVSQEAEWGFSPRGKLAELTLRDAFSTSWRGDGERPFGHALAAHRARTPGVLAWEASPLLSRIDASSR
ncbi:MAG: hypothetical protein EXR75_14205 [Myxococcales bacterium]|nr:hypothetical protein [Myxococcales bacterium]